jgi:hypothetical protein
MLLRNIRAEKGDSAAVPLLDFPLRNMASAALRQGRSAPRQATPDRRAFRPLWNPDQRRSTFGFHRQGQAPDTSPLAGRSALADPDQRTRPLDSVLRRAARWRPGVNQSLTHRCQNQFFEELPMPAMKATDRLLDAISRLKRAAHIENLKHLEDHWRNGECIIFTGTQASCDILENLLTQALSARHSPEYWREHPGQKPHEKIEASEHDYDIFQIKFPVSEKSCQILAGKIEDLTETLIASDHQRSR